MKKITYDLATNTESIVDDDTPKLVLTDEQKAFSAREKRDKKLQETDWRAASDLTLSADWAAYRQALRDVPQQEGFPSTITWPTKPE
jgi:hypothetical protein